MFLNSVLEGSEEVSRALPQSPACYCPDTIVARFAISAPQPTLCKEKMGSRKHFFFDLIRAFNEILLI